jgi:hypothetical protein
MVVLAALFLLAACGGTASGDAGASGGGGMSLSIVEPSDGAQVSTPFTIRVQASVPLGTQASGLHHIHVWFDGDANKYQVVEADHVEIDSGRLTAGQHVIHASLRNANHSPAGAETQETVTVGNGGSAPPASPNPPTDGGYGY